MANGRIKHGLIFLAALFATGSHASVDTKTTSFAVTRNGSQIGVTTIRIEKDGQQTTVELETHVAVRVLFLTVYRFDQSETERWSNGRLLSMRSMTDDNGTSYKTMASGVDDGVVVQVGGREKRIAGTVLPVSLWNEAVLGQSRGLNPVDGNVVSVKAADQGEDDLLLQGRQTRARHYVITTTFSQDAWYDEQHRLVKLQIKARDGSVIRYELVSSSGTARSA